MSKINMPAISMAALRAARPSGVYGPVRNDAASAETLLRDVQQRLEDLNGSIKQTAETALAEAKKAGEVSAETKATADQALSAKSELQAMVNELKSPGRGRAVQ